MSPATPLVSDHALARRLDRAEGVAGARYVEAHARLAPQSGAAWTEIAGTYAMYDGPRSPVTQTFGLGLFQAIAPADLDAIESFFRERGAPVSHDTCPLADKSVWPLLSQRGYRPVEFSSVMFLPLADRLPCPEPLNPNVRSRLAGPQDREVWAQVGIEGWRELADLSDLLPEIMMVSASRADSLYFLAELGRQAVAVGALFVHQGVALLAGACTIPEARRQGAQRSLLETRLRYAQESGCDLAMMCAEPGSASQRNAERHGFRIAYTRTKWGLEI